MSETVVERGCGTREEDSLYACVDCSILGQPIEFFLVDPVVAWKGSETLRAPMLIGDSKDINHVVLGVGKRYYPFVSDFVEEARILGVSKKFPRDFDPSRLTPNKSKLLLMHARAIPHFPYTLNMKRFECPKHIGTPHRCVGALWQLSTLKEFGKLHYPQQDLKLKNVMHVRTPSTTYIAIKPKKPIQFVDQYGAGIFLAFPKFHFEYVNRKGNVPRKIGERIQKAGFTLDVKEN